MASVRLDHLHIRSLDPEVAASFYVECFGAHIADRHETSGTTRVVVSFEDFRLFIEQASEDTSLERANASTAFDHFAIRTDDWDGVIERLKTRGTPFVRELPPRPGLKAVFILAPDNVLIEVIDRTP